jgi:hypothetical protein
MVQKPAKSNFENISKLALKITTRHSFAALMILLIFGYSCKKETILTDESAIISISADSLKFDTVFTQTGSVTQSFKIKNSNNQPIVLSSIKLMGGINNPFKMNVNGVAATEAIDLSISANDSIYVFVMVNINPNNTSNPFIVSDSIRIICNNNSYHVQLEAYGQNAHFYNSAVISNDTTWTNDLPFVVLGGLTIDSNATLTLQEGCRVYMHSNAAIMVDGTLKVNGTADQQIEFAGDRTDDPYRYLPGSWPGIHFNTSSKNNELNFCSIKNATIGLLIENPSTNGTPKVTAHQIIIDNASEAGLLIENSNANIDNSLVSNCKKNVVIQGGGNSSFVSCTLTAYPTLYQFHEFPMLEINNYGFENGNIISRDLKTVFTNCVVWSNSNMIDNEIIVTKEGNGIFDVLLENSLIKNSTDPNNTTLTNVIKNIDPQFDSIDIENNYFDFRTQNNLASPLQNTGKLTPFQKDLDNRPRVSGTATDIGCYEKQE